MKSFSWKVLLFVLLAFPLVTVAVEESHWSFLPPQRPSLPLIDNSGWCRTPVDYFVLQKQQQRSLKPSLQASRDVLIRRAAMDLTGLPPTRRQVESFQNDNQPGAWNRVVERLLASPRYGERWGRHWLDLARYADSNGFEFDFVRPHAWHYRDYVIASFNQDKPYDTFVREQLAGDEINRDDFSCWVATGFCRNGPTVGNQTLEKNRYEELHDVISATSEVFLGLTVGCARCHDHKFDPITQEDYYSLQAIFHTTGKRSHLLGSAEDRTNNSQWSARIRELRKKIKQLSNAPSRGDWQLRDGELHQRAIAPNIRIGFGDPDWTDYTVTLEFMKTSGTSEAFNFEAGIYLVLRASEFKNGLSLHLGASDNREHAIQREVNNSPALLAPRIAGSIQEERWYRLKVAVKGTSLQATIDDRPLFSVEDGNLPSGQVNLVNWLCQTRWRNLRITTPDGTLLQDGFLPIEQSLLPATSTVDFTRDSVNAEIASLEARIARLPIAMSITDDSPQPRETRIQLRGDYRQTGAIVGPGVPRSLAPEAIAFPPPAEGAVTTGRRSVLANWITAENNPLTARVMVNRIWQHHFGRGLVETPSNFGVMGSEPSHPGLLDWLAVEFMDSGWSIKQMHRLIMQSATYQQSSIQARHKAGDHPDPDATWLTRYSQHRHDAEVIRDRILWASRSLNQQMGGPGVMPRIHPSVVASSTTRKWPTVEEEGPGHWRRSIYILVRRSVMFPFLESLDAPVTTQSCDRRVATIVPTQALQMMNSHFVNDQAGLMARAILREHAGSPAAQVDKVYWRTLSRPPERAERKDCLQFLRMMADDHRQQLSGDHLSRDELASTIEARALEDLCHVAFNLNEFVFQQ